ncbi:phage tail terminator family protein [Paenibacillus sp. BAC0078]
MTVQQLRENIIAALEESFPGVPVYVDGNKPQIAYFRVELISSTYDRQREGKYMAVYRYGIRYEQGGLLDSEGMADGLCEALAMREREQPSFRVMRQAWEAGTEGSGPLFTVDYMLYLHKEIQPEPGIKMMGHLTEGERLK